MQCQITLPLLRHLLTKMNSEQVVQAQTKMKKLAQNKKQFLPIIFAIMTDPVEEQWIKTLASSFLNDLFMFTLNEQNSSVIYKTLVEILSTPLIKQMDKKIFGKSITKWLQFTVQEQRLSWISFITQCIKDSHFYETALIVINSISVADIPINLLQKAIICTYQNYLQVEIILQNVHLLTEILKMWITVIDKLHGEKKMRKFLQNMISSELWFSMLRSIYQIEAENDTIISLYQSFTDFNLVKKEAAQVNKKILDVQMNKSDSGLMTVLSFTECFLPRFANTLKILVSNNNHCLSKSNCEDLQIALIGIVRIYLSIKPEQFSTQTAIFFQNNVILPLLAVNQAELQKFQQSQQDFLSLAEDCCDSQKNGILKTEAAKFLQCLGDEVEGSLAYSMGIAIQSIGLKFGYIQIKTVNSDKKLQFQTALLVVSIFSCKISTYPQQITFFQSLLSDKRTKLASPLELSRIFTFLAYNYFQIFDKPQNGEEWVLYALNYQGHPTTRHCGLDFVCNVVENFFNQMLLEKIGEQIQKGHENLIWQIVQIIIQNHFNSLSDQTLTFLSCKLYSRIQKEQQMLRLGEKYNNLDLIRCFRTFNYILKEVQKSIQATQTKKSIIETVCFVFNFYPNTVLLKLGSEIVKIAIQLINAISFISPQIQQYTRQFITTFKTNYCNKNYLRYFNQFLNKIDFNTNQSILMQIMIVLKDALEYLLGKLQLKQENRLKSFPHFRLPLSSILILIQNLIALFGTHLIASQNLQFIQIISQLCIDILPKTKQNIQKSSSEFIIMSRTLNTLFLCHMHLKVSSIHSYLITLQSENLYHGYDTKVIMKCISIQIFNEEDLKQVVFLLDFLKHIMENSEIKDQYISENKKKKNNCLKAWNRIKKLEEYDKFLENIDTPFKTEKNPTLILTELFIKMKTNNYDMFNQVLQDLSAETLCFFSKYLDFQTVQKKKRTYKTVIRFKIDEQQVNNSTLKNQENNSEEDLNFKRERIKMKKAGKGTKRRKQQRQKKLKQEE